MPRRFHISSRQLPAVAAIVLLSAIVPVPAATADNHNAGVDQYIERLPDSSGGSTVTDDDKADGGGASGGSGSTSAPAPSQAPSTSETEGSDDPLRELREAVGNKHDKPARKPRQAGDDPAPETTTLPTAAPASTSVTPTSDSSGIGLLLGGLVIGGIVVAMVGWLRMRRRASREPTAT